MMDHLNSATIGFVYALAIRVSCFFPSLGWNIPPLVDHHRQVDDVTAQHGSVIAAICICQSFRSIHIFFGQYRYTQNWVKSALDIQMTFGKKFDLDRLLIYFKNGSDRITICPNFSPMENRFPQQISKPLLSDDITQ